MNRKGVREQNDISNIIVLPQRLQKKIVESAGQSSLIATLLDENEIDNNTELERFMAKVSDCKYRTRITQDNAAVKETGVHIDVPQINFFLQRCEKNAGYHNSDCTDAFETNESVDATNCVKNKHSSVDLAIPGILRLSTIEAAQLQSSENNVKYDDGRKQLARHIYRNDFYSKGSLAAQAPLKHNLKKIKYPVWFDILDALYIKDLKQHYEILNNVMTENTVVENWQNICESRSKLKEIFKQLLLNNLKFCCEQKVDSFFWKILYYKVKDNLKDKKVSVAAVYTFDLIEEGLKFYDELLTELRSKYFSDNSAEYQIQQIQRSVHKFNGIAKVAAQKLLICLGDLSRYKVKHLQGDDFTEAANYYQQAQALIPSNGIPYNQLAVVAIQGRRKFDAVYYHMRSLMSSNAINSARESLLVLFDEIRKKYEETEPKISPLHQQHPINNNKNSKSLRKEVWIYPDGVRRLHRTNVNNVNKSNVAEENRLNELSPEDLLRHFISLYLYIIGKLYTGIGMETIQEQQRKLLMQLSSLLKRDTLIITQTRILKIVALNIFILEHNMHKESRREIRYHAFNLFNQMFGLILRKCNQLFAAQMEDETIAASIMEKNVVEFSVIYLSELNILLQFVKIYTVWLAQNIQIWEPIRSEEHTVIYCWPELQRLFSNLKIVSKHKVLIDGVDSEEVLLNEDIFLSGFTPLSNVRCSSLTKSCTATLAKNSSNDHAQFYTRIDKILSFHKCYEENQKQLLMVESESTFILEDLNSEIKNVIENLQCRNDIADEETDFLVNDLSDRNVHTEMQVVASSCRAEEDDQMTQLLKLKNELKAKTNGQKMYHDKLEEILEFVDTKLYIEVRPRYLLPDTNCFIDCLEDFERLAKEFKHYALIVPLTVVKELDGLSKGVKVETYEKSLQKNRIHHFDDVSSRAKKSLEFIRVTKNVKCATTKGSIINASMFALVEEGNISNDDKILATALSLSKTMSTETSKDGKCFIQTELVLITTDRNLRVKALSRNLAVSELSEFLQWAKDCHI